MSDEEIIERTVEDLNRLGIINKDDVILTTAYRFKYAYVIYDLNYRENLKTIHDYLDTIGIDSIGRFGGWEYLNMDAVVKTVKKYAGLNL